GLGGPPNPVRDLDNGLDADQQAAMDFYASATRISDGVLVQNFGFNCNGCHVLDPSQGFYGTDGQQSFENEPQIMKIAQLRNLYTKVGMFGMIDVPFVGGGNNGHQGDQIRGFGFLHDGSTDTLFRFFSATVFDGVNANIGFRDDDERRAMEQLMLAFDSDVAPIVGQQITVAGSGDTAALARLDELIAAAERPFVSRLLGGTVTDCELVAKTPGDGRVLGFAYENGNFVPDDGGASLTREGLVALSDTAPVTFTAALPGSGRRLGIDRDGDGRLDGLDPCPQNADPDCNVVEPGPETGDTGMPPEPEPPVDTGSPTDPELPVPPVVDGPEDCGCASSGSPMGWLWLVAAAALVGLRRRDLTVPACGDGQRSMRTRGAPGDMVPETTE
ncbi:MAG: MYXO-CTERM sorting domain-containing protein, partial [Myxococcota bacterium]